MVEVVLGWTGDSFVPLKRSEKLCNEQFVVGERYIADIGSQTSAAKRGFFFATLKEIYSSLPDDIADRWISFEHFRKALTIECGYATQMDFTAASKAEAVRIAAFVRSAEPYTVVSVKDAVVTKWTARSASAREMDGRTFSALVDAVLAKAADLIGVDRKALENLHKTPRRDKADKQIAEFGGAGSGVAEPEHAAKPEGSARPDPSGRRRLTYDEATAMIPMAVKIGAAVIRPDGGLSKSEWTLDEVLYDLKHAAVIALSDKAPGFPLGMQDRNGRVVYFQIRDHGQ